MVAHVDWICRYYALTYARDGTKRVLDGKFDMMASFTDPVKACEYVLNKRVRLPHIWFGVGITIVTPLGQKIERVIESRHYGIMLVEE